MVMVEDTERGDFGDLILSDPGSAKFIRRAGSDVKRGETVLERGAALDAGAVGLLAALGVTKVPCHARPRVGLLTTGDEVVPPSTKTLAPGKIRDANGPALEAAILEAGAVVAARVHAADTLDAALGALDSLAGCDVIVSSGGVSVGVFDFVKEAFSQRGELDFWRIAIKPGKPLAFGRIGDGLFFGLPGNPVSSLVTFELFVRPVLRRLSGHKNVLRPQVSATLAADLPHEPGRREFVAPASSGREGCLATPTGAQGSHRLSSMAGADALLVAHEDRGDYKAGDTLPALLLA
jgi:molybdopterin molybdotransferase